MTNRMSGSDKSGAKSSGKGQAALIKKLVPILLMGLVLLVGWIAGSGSDSASDANTGSDTEQVQTDDSGASISQPDFTDSDTEPQASNDTEPQASNDTRPAFEAVSNLPIIHVADLPLEALDTLDLIASGGPYPFSQDDSVFQNREQVLPDHQRGYYQEYTVITPDLGHRGARRVVAGEGGELYYTSDHYESFSEIGY